MTEAEARAALRAFVGDDDIERWIAEQPWQAVPGGWVVLEPFQGWRFRMEVVPGGVCVLASDGWGEPAVWFVPRRPDAHRRKGRAPASA